MLLGASGAVVRGVGSRGGTLAVHGGTLAIKVGPGSKVAPGSQILTGLAVCRGVETETDCRWHFP
jgi:hypothetical protein